MADIVGVDESANIMDSDYVAENLKQQIQIGTQHEHQHEFESENIKDGEIDNQTESQFDPNSLATADSTTNTETFDDEFQFKEISQLSKAEREAEALLDFENEAQCQSESQSGVLGVETGDSAMGLIDVGQDVLNMNLHSNSSGQFDIDAANFNLQSQPEPGIATEGCVDTDPIVSFSNTNDDNALFNDNSPLISGIDVSVEKDQPFAPKSALLELDPQTPNSDVFAGGDNTNINEDVLLLNNEKPLLDGITMDPESTHADVLKPESQFASMPKSAGVAADSPTLLSDDKPVKMPKATTIATPTKSAPTPARCSSSNSAACFVTWMKQLDPKVWDVLLWRDPRVTGVVLSLLMLLLLSISSYSIISVVSYLLLTTLIIAFTARVIKFVVAKVHSGDDSHPFKDLLDADIAISESVVQECAVSVVQRLNDLLNWLRDLVFVREFGASFKISVVLFAMTYVGGCFNGLTILTLAVAAMFTLPKFYEVKKVQIDQYVDVAMSKFDDCYSRLADAVPYLKKQKSQ